MDIIYQNWCNPTVIFVALVTIVIGFAYVHFLPALNYFHRLGLAGPRPTLLFGNLLQLGGAAHLVHLQWSREYGKTFGCFFGRSPVMFVADRDMIKAITVKYAHNFSDRWSIYKPPSPLGLGLISLDGQAWRRIHNLLLPIFTDARLKLLMPYITKSITTLVKKLNKSIDHQLTIDLWQYINQFSMEVIMSTSFGIKASSQENPDRITHEARKLYHNYYFRSFIVSLSPNLYKAYEKLIGSDRRSLSYIEQVLRKIINERRQPGTDKYDYKGYPDLLQAMLEIRDDDQQLTDDQVIGQCMDYLVAGSETTTSAIAFTIYLLAVNPHIQKKLRNQISQRYSANDILTLDGIASITYLDMVVAESLRLYPPVYIYERNTNTEAMINGYVFPKNIGVIIPVYTVHRDPEYWPEPDQFNPERFEFDSHSKRLSCSYIPFGSGPRTCIGSTYALLIIKMALIKLLLTFQFDKIDSTEEPLQLTSNMILSPKNGMYLGIRTL